MLADPLQPLQLAFALHARLNELFNDPSFMEEFNAWGAMWRTVALFACLNRLLFGEPEH
jgi:hypothetical protein